MDALVLRLYEIEAVKFGNFKLKSGIFSPIYLDLRVIVSYPDVLRQVSEAMWSCVKQGGADFDVICGVPYTALPIATSMALTNGLNMLMRRKEVKDYGTKKAIEGHFAKGQKCLIVEDLVTSGASVMETLDSLNQAGLQCSDVVVLIDRQQGGRENLDGNGLKLHSALTITEIMQVLQRNNKLSDEVVGQVKQFISDNQVKGISNSAGTKNGATEKKRSLPRRLTYEEKSVQAQNKALKKLYQVMTAKRSNLSVAVDVTSRDRLLRIADAVGPHVCCIKTHVDILDDWDDATAESLAGLAKKHNFLIFEDRKFADIGNTVASQFSGGVYKISSWADIVNAHIVPGPGIIQGLKLAGMEKGLGLLLLAEMSSEGTMATGEYTKAAAAMAEQNKDFVIGFISVNPNQWADHCPDQSLVQMTPGIKLGKGGDGLGQQYNDPQSAIERGTDIIIVGRGIYKAEDPCKAAQEYQKAGWDAYLACTGQREQQ